MINFERMMGLQIKLVQIGTNNFLLDNWTRDQILHLGTAVMTAILIEEFFGMSFCADQQNKLGFVRFIVLATTKANRL